MFASTIFVEDAKLIHFNPPPLNAVIIWIWNFTTCATRFIVYLLTCPCKKQCVGCTIRTFSVRVNEHLASIKKGRINHSVPRHYLKHHNKDPTGTQFQVIDKFIPHVGELSYALVEVYWDKTPRARCFSSPHCFYDHNFVLFVQFCNCDHNFVHIFVLMYVLLK